MTRSTLCITDSASARILRNPSQMASVVTSLTARSKQLIHYRLLSWSQPYARGICYFAHTVQAPSNDPHKLTKTAGPLARRRSRLGAASNCTRASRRLHLAPATACWSRQPPRRFVGGAREAVFAA